MLNVNVSAPQGGRSDGMERIETFLAMSEPAWSNAEITNVTNLDDAALISIGD
jgi:hypothetical protein